MPKVVVTAQVEEPVRWEEGFRTHGELFRSYTVDTPLTFGITEGNEVAICLEPADLDTFRAGMVWSPPIAVIETAPIWHGSSLPAGFVQPEHGSGEEGSCSQRSG